MYKKIFGSVLKREGRILLNGINLSITWCASHYTMDCPSLAVDRQSAVFMYVSIK